MQDEQIELFYETGVHDSSLTSEEVLGARANDDEKMNLPFVGRLVPLQRCWHVN